MFGQRVYSSTNGDIISSGTLGLYRAMRILGYKTYHLAECIFVHGLPHMEVFEEAITAQYNELSGVKKFDRSDYERWLGDYNVS
jgi:hypothetical protein